MKFWISILAVVVVLFVIMPAQIVSAQEPLGKIYVTIEGGGIVKINPETEEIVDIDGIPLEEIREDILQNQESLVELGEGVMMRDYCPSSNQFAWVSWKKGWQVFVSIDGQTYQLTDVGTSVSPSWSPDCKKLVYKSTEGGLWQIRTMGLELPYVWKHVINVRPTPWELIGASNGFLLWVP